MRDDGAGRVPASRPVVTIFEHYGSGASTVGQKVAEGLGLPFHPQAFTSEAIEGGQESATEQGATLARVYSVLGGAYGGFEGRDIVTTQQQKYELVMDNNRQVWGLADQGGVIVGRNSAVILAERPGTVHVLLTGSEEDRAARAAREDGISAERAMARQKREDQVRADMSIILYGWDPRLPDRYDIVINTSRIPPEAAVKAIVDIMKVITA